MAISIISENLKSEVFAKHLNESLFDVIYNLEGNLSPNYIEYSMVELWRDAKDIAMKVLTSKRDLTMFDFAISIFNNQLMGSLGKDPDSPLWDNEMFLDGTYQTYGEIKSKIKKCIRAIILCHYYFVQPDKLQTTKIPFNGLDTVKEALENGEIVHDYDYACGCGLDDDASHASDGPIPLDKAVDIIERAQNRFPGGSIAFSQVDKVYDKLIEEAKDNENEATDVTLNADNVATEEVKPENEARVEEVNDEGDEYTKLPRKVVLAVLFRMLEGMGVDFEKRGVKKLAGELVEALTEERIPSRKAAEYFGLDDYNSAYHADEVAKMNRLLAGIGLNIHL